MCLLTWFAVPPFGVIEQRTTTAPPASLAAPPPDWASWSHDLPRTSATWVWGCRIAVGEAETTPVEPLGVYLSLLGAYEVYWDGVLIARNGLPGNDRRGEQPGRLRYTFVVPPHLLTPGEHFLSAKISSFHAPPGKQFLDFDAGDSRRLARADVPQTVFYMSLLSGSLPAALLFLGLFVWVERRWEYLIFSGIALLFPILLLLEFSKFLINYTYDWHFTRLQAIVVVTLALAWLLPLFFTLLYRLRLSPRYYGGFIAATLFIAWIEPYYDAKGTIAVILALIASLVLSFKGMKRRMVGARVMALGLATVLVSFILANSVFHDNTFFLSLLGLIITVMGLLIHRFRAKNEEVLQARLQAEQLKGELLRKQIHPHFLMNSLTTAMEYMEENPRQGVVMVDALSAAFRLMLDLCDREVVTVAQEIELCQAHLATMNFVTDRAMRLETQNLDPSRPMPPGVFLTLLENAITHGRYDVARPFVSVRREPLNGSARYHVVSLLKNGTASPRIGTGTRYIEARLRQVFGEGWHLETAVSDQTWTTLLEVPEDVKHPRR
nr:histidine kinase [Acanthopleuribacter pedis]